MTKHLVRRRLARKMWWRSALTLHAALLLLCLCTATTLPAQALPTATGPGSNITLGGGISWFQQDYGQRQIGGGFAFLDVHPHWRYGLEGEIRLLRWDAAQQVTESSYLAGPKVIVARHPTAVQPYVKLLVGAGRITLPYGYAHGTFLDYAPGAGVDIALPGSLKVRLIDVEYQHWPDFPYGSLHPYGISMGVSLRLTPLYRLPRR